MPDRPWTGAQVRGFTAAVLAPVLRAEVVPRLPVMARAVAAGRLDPAALAELRETLLAVDQAAAQWWAWASADGSAAVPATETGPPSTEIDTETAATMLRRTPRRVVQLIHSGHIVARPVGRVWLVDRASVELYRLEASGGQGRQRAV